MGSGGNICDGGTGRNGDGGGGAAFGAAASSSAPVGGLVLSSASMPRGAIFGAVCPVHPSVVVPRSQICGSCHPDVRLVKENAELEPSAAAALETKMETAANVARADAVSRDSALRLAQRKHSEAATASTTRKVDVTRAINVLLATSEVCLTSGGQGWRASTNSHLPPPLPAAGLLHSQRARRPASYAFDAHRLCVLAVWR